MTPRKSTKVRRTATADKTHEFMQMAASQIGSMLDSEEAASAPMPGSKKNMKSKTPWLVKERDLRRHLGRAVAACSSGRVIFFNYHYKGTNRMLVLAPYPDSNRVLIDAKVDFENGKYRKVVLADLPLRNKR